jgi:hypothetical protein
MDEALPWFSRFVLYHIAANPHHGFPKYTRGDVSPAGKAQNEAFVAYFGVWKRAFLERNVTEEEANGASVAMAVRGAVFPDEHLAFLLHHIDADRAARRHAEQVLERRRLAQRHRADADERERLRAVFAQLPFEEQKAIREHVLEPYVTLPGERFIMTLCVERLREIRAKGHGR